MSKTPKTTIRIPSDWIPIAVAVASVGLGVAAISVAIAGKLYMLAYVILPIVIVPWARTSIRTNRMLRETAVKLAENDRLLAANAAALARRRGRNAGQ